MKSRFFLLSVILLAGCQNMDNPTAPLEKSASSTASVVPKTINQTSTTESSIKANIPTLPSPQTQTNAITIAPKPIAPLLTPQTQKNLWNAIGMQLDLDHIPNDSRIDYYRNWYLKNPRQLRIVAERAKPFLYYITQQVEKRHLPIELALLPIVESSFDQFAYSQSHAGGLWQIIPATGRNFGLKDNDWYDGRFDVVASTNAALDLLEYLHNKFGSWTLALAAYNCGEGRVFRAIRQNKQEGLPTNFWALSLPRETSDYVPKLYAVAQIIANPSFYKVAIPSIPNRPVIKEINPKTQMNLSIAAKYAGISLQKLQDLNPAYKQWQTGEQQQKLLLPTTSIKKFELAIRNPNHTAMLLSTYRVKAGDSLGLIAQHHQTNVKKIQSLNNLKNNTIRIGQNLRIPSSLNSSINKKQSINKNTPKDSQLLIYKVQQGDDLWTIAKNYHISLNNLITWSNIDENEPLRLGQKLHIWQPKNNEKDINEIYYTVKSGETLSQIAENNHVKIHNIIQWNDLINDRQLLKSGEKLRLFQKGIKQKKTKSKNIEYRVKKGDSLSKIADRYNVTVKELIRWNKIKNSRQLKLGQELMLYVNKNSV
jgi:membrane-bound lytic murein transglycosylase D